MGEFFKQELANCLLLVLDNCQISENTVCVKFTGIDVGHPSRTVPLNNAGVRDFETGSMQRFIVSMRADFTIPTILSFGPN